MLNLAPFYRFLSPKNTLQGIPFLVILINNVQYFYTNSVSNCSLNRLGITTLFDPL